MAGWCIIPIGGGIGNIGAEAKPIPGGGPSGGGSGCAPGVNPGGGLFGGGSTPGMWKPRSYLSRLVLG